MCKEEKELTGFHKQSNCKDGHSTICKLCKINLTRKLPFVITLMYNAQVSSSKRRGHAPPEYTKDSLLSWLVGQPLFERLWNEWVDSGHLKHMKPSVDRIDDYKGYSMDNIQLMTWGENNKKGRDDVLRGVNNKKSKPTSQYEKDGTFIAKFHSACEAGRVIGRSNAQSNITQCCKGNVKYAYGFMWRYSD